MAANFMNAIIFLAHSAKALFDIQQRRFSVNVGLLRCSILALVSFEVAVKAIIWERSIFQFVIAADCVLIYLF